MWCLTIIPMMGLDGRSRHKVSRWMSKRAVGLRRVMDVMTAVLVIAVLASAFLMSLAVGAQLMNGGDPVKEFLWTGH